MLTMSVTQVVKNLSTLTNPSEPITISNAKSHTKSVVLPYELYEEYVRTAEKLKELEKKRMQERVRESILSHDRENDSELGAFLDDAAEGALERVDARERSV